jgi:hypothetical protein
LTDLTPILCPCDKKRLNPPKGAQAGLSLKKGKRSAKPLLSWFANISIIIMVVLRNENKNRISKQNDVYIPQFSVFSFHI